MNFEHIEVLLENDLFHIVVTEFFHCLLPLHSFIGKVDLFLRQISRLSLESAIEGNFIEFLVIIQLLDAVRTC